MLASVLRFVSKKRVTAMQIYNFIRQALISSKSEYRGKKLRCIKLELFSGNRNLPTGAKVRRVRLWEQRNNSLSDSRKKTFVHLLIVVQLRISTVH
ncbi:hypothetical protein T09_2392, partial [Trichinella sp. T9]